MHSHVCTHARNPARTRAYAAYNAHMQVLVGNKLDLRERRDERTPLLNEACPTAACPAGYTLLCFAAVGVQCAAGGGEYGSTVPVIYTAGGVQTARAVIGPGLDGLFLALLVMVLCA